MDDKDKLIHELQLKVYSLESRVEYLQDIMMKAKIPYETTQPEEIVMNANSTEEDQGARILSEVITRNHAQYFYSIFKGRMDVYSKRCGKPNPKSGKTGYWSYTRKTRIRCICNSNNIESRKLS